MQNFCSSCGARLKDGARFCSNCGKPILTSEQDAPMVQQFKQNVPIINTVPDIYIKGNHLDKARRILNFVSDNQLVEWFSYSNGIVSLKTLGEKSLQAPLNQLSVSFQYWANTRQRTVKIKYQGCKIELVETPASMNKLDFDKIIAVLSQAGTTYNLDSMTQENMAVANQLENFQRGYRLAKTLNNWR